MDGDEMNENNLIRDVMSEMGWQDTFVPYSSDASKKLMDEIKFLGNTKLARVDELENLQNEAFRIEQSLKSADDELDHNLKLLTAHKSQCLAEHHLFKLSEHEESKFKRMVKEAEKSLNEQTLEQKSQINEKEKISKSIDKLTEVVQWARKALAEWRQIMSSGEETKKMIEKFCRMDAGRAEALDSKRKILHETIVKNQRFLLNAYEEKKSLELLLERTSHLYRQAHLERRHMVCTWKDAVSQMNQREKDIREMEVEIENAKKESEEKRAYLQREEKIFKMKQDENSEIEFLTQKLNINASDLRNRLLRLEDSFTRKSSELLALRKTVQNESEKLNNMRNENRQMLSQEKDKEMLLKSTVDELKKMHEKFEKFKSNNCNAQERLRQIEEMLGAENKNIKRAQDESVRLQATLFRSEQQLKKLQCAAQNLTLERQALESGISRTRAFCKTLAKELLRQTEILYNVDYKIQNAEMRLENIRGTVDEEEAQVLDNRRKHLEKLLEDKIKADDLMKTQIARIEEDMKKLLTIFQHSNHEYEKINDRLKKKRISVEGGDRQQKVLHQLNQEKLVEQNLLKIRIAQMEKEIAKQTDKAYSLEKHKVELEAAMTDRLINVNSQMNVLKMKRKCLIEERAQMKADLGERLLKIEQLKKRYELSMDLLGKNDDGTTVTAVQIKIEMAQEKYLLLNKGNKMNEKILKAEDELRRLENTVKLMNFSNDQYKKIFDSVNVSSPEVKRMDELTHKYLQATTDIKTLKESLVEILDSIEILDRQRYELVKELEEVQRTKLDNNDSLLKIHKEIVDQETKIERAQRDMKTTFKAAKRHIKDQEFIRLFEKSMVLKENDEKNNSALQQLADLVDIIPDMSQTVTRHFIERGLCLPALNRRGKSQCSWKSDTSLGDQSLKSDAHCLKRYSHRSILSGSSTSSSDASKSSSKKSAKLTVSQQSGLSVVKIAFPDSFKTPKNKDGRKH